MKKRDIVDLLDELLERVEALEELVADLDVDFDELLEAEVDEVL